MITSAIADAKGVSAKQCTCAKDSFGVSVWNDECPQHGLGPRRPLAEVLAEQPRTVVPIEDAPSGISVLRGLVWGVAISGVGVLAIIGLVTVIAVAYAAWHLNS